MSQSSNSNVRDGQFFQFRPLQARWIRLDCVARAYVTSTLGRSVKLVHTRQAPSSEAVRPKFLGMLWADPTISPADQKARAIKRICIAIRGHRLVAGLPSGLLRSNGAAGYVCKSDIERELLPAMDAALGGTKFVSARLRPYLTL